MMEPHRVAYWTGVEARAKSEPETVIIQDGSVYKVGPYNAPDYDKGFAGRCFTVQFIGSGRLVRTDNLEWVGVVPPEFRERIPDTVRIYDGWGTPKPANHARWQQVGETGCFGAVAQAARSVAIAFLAVAALALGAPAADRFTWTGAVDYGAAAATASGWFDYDPDAPIIWAADNSQIQDNALAGFSLLLADDVYVRQAAHYATTRGESRELMIQDAPLADGRDSFASFNWTPRAWVLQVWDDTTSAIIEIGGRVLAVYREAYVDPVVARWSEPASASIGDDFQDAAPVPEPASIALLGSALAGFGIFRAARRRKVRP